MSYIQPTRSARGIFTPGTGILLDSGQLLPEVNGIVNLPYAATLWLNAGGNIRVILLNNVLNIRDSALYKNVQGDFHRVVKAICAPDTTIFDIVLDYREDIKIKKY